MVSGEGSEATISHNRVVGTPATYELGQAAQNGIQVSFGADAYIHHNWVSHNNYTPNPDLEPEAASGILSYDAGDVTIE